MRKATAGALRGTLLLGAGLAIGAFAGVQAVEARQDAPVRLTLEEALRLAERSNPGYRQTLNDLELNRIDRSDAWLTLLPTPQITALSTGLAWNLQTLGLDPFGNPVDNPEARMVQSSNSTQRLGVGFQVDFRNVLNLRQQATQAELREIGALTTVRNLRADVARAFLDAQERQVTLELEEELFRNAEQNLEVTHRLYRLARRNRIDLLSAELDLVERENQLEVARTEVEQGIRALRNLIGDGELGEVELVPEPLLTFEPARLDEEALVAEALDRSPRMEQARAQLRSSERDISTRRAQWLPVLSVSMNTARQELDIGGGGAFLVPNPEGDWSRNVSLQLSFPDLGQYFNIRNNTNRARIQARNQQESLRQARLEVEQEIRSLLEELRRSRNTLELQELRAELSEERRGLQLQAYQLGRTGYLELQNASEAAAQARRSALQAAYAFERARINLERALGRPVPGS
jgi:outer membrane protein TolC